jgi:hypothetical protein
VALQEPSDQIRDQVGLLVQSEVAGVEDTHLGARDVPAVRLSLLDLERRVLAASDDLQRRLVLAGPVVPDRVNPRHYRHWSGSRSRGPPAAGCRLAVSASDGYGMILIERRVDPEDATYRVIWVGPVP